MNWSKRPVAVTGAAGFLGSHLCEALVSRGAEVYALDDFSVGAVENLSAVKNDITILKCDITDYDELSVLRRASVVFHLAALADPRACQADFNLAFKVNVDGTKNVLEACRQSQVCERAVFTSSASVYGNPEYVPIDEKHPLNGKDPYSITKIIGQYLCQNYRESCNLPVTIVHNFNIFGPRQTTAYLIPTLITQALEKERIEIWSSKPSRDFTYVDNAVDALLKIAEQESLLGERVNLGTGIEIKAGELAAKIAAIHGGIPVIDLKKETVGSTRLCCDNRKLTEKTGWKPGVSFEEGLKRTIQWFRQHKSS